MKIFILSLFLSSPLISNAQILKVSDLKNSSWFTNNDDYKFYKSDTITLYKIANAKDKIVKLNNVYIKSRRAKANEFREFQFIRNGKLKFVDFNISKWQRTEYKDDMSWNYDEDEKKLSLLLNDNENYSFKLVSVKNGNLVYFEKNNEAIEHKIFFQILTLTKLK